MSNPKITTLMEDTYAVPALKPSMACPSISRLKTQTSGRYWSDRKNMGKC